MPAECRSVLKSCLARFVREDACGVPVVGTASVLTTKGFISVTATAQIEDGEEFILKNACGELCINEIDCDQFKRYDLEIQLCQIDPELLELISNTRLLTDNAAVSRGFALGETNLCENFSLELWNRVTPVECVPDPNNPGQSLPEWYWFAFPWVTNGVMSDITFENGPLTLTINARTHSASPSWGRGTAINGECILPPTATSQTTDHLLAYITNVQPPEPVCGLQELTQADRDACAV